MGKVLKKCVFTDIKKHHKAVDNVAQMRENK